MTKTAKRARSVICTLLAFILSLSVTLTVACATLGITALNPAFAVKTVARSQYSERLAEELQEEFISYGNACNINESFFEVVFLNDITPARIDADTETVLREFYAGEVQDTVNTEDLHDALLNRLTDYAVEQGFAVEPTDENELYQNLSVIADELCDIYNAYVSVFSMSVFKTASRMLATYRPYAWYGAGAGAVLFVISAVLLRLYYQKKKNYLRFFIYGFSASALMLAVAPAAALILRIGNQINIASASLYSLATGMMNGTLAAILLSALVPTLVTVLLVLVRKKAVQNNC
ncbi:MAG: hypothetical protein ACI4LB_00355 [Candidatus Fimenecus sp.]